jgi:nucleoside phosphorylase
MCIEIYQTWLTKKRATVKVASMYLITMAHPGEAQGVIETFQLKKHQSDVWIGEDFVLLITGEGPFEAATRTALEISRHSLSHILNIGIAGTISEKVKVGDIVEVRSVYLVQELRPTFKSFELSPRGHDCLTSFERILDPEKATLLRGLGSLVDRELWGVAMAAKTAGLPVSSWKIISDDAGSLKACELVKEMAQELSDKIARKLSEKSGGTKLSLLPPGFHMTFTMRHRLETLLTKLSLKQGICREEYFKKLPLENFLLQEVPPKERGKLLLEYLEQKIDPFRSVVNEVTTSLKKKFEEEGVKITFDPTLESHQVIISFEAQDDETIRQKALALKKLSLAPLEKLMKGSFHVE